MPLAFTQEDFLVVVGLSICEYVLIQKVHTTVSQ